MPSPYRGRFAPSPTGPLHFGSLVAALGSWLFARQAGGEWLLRVEDIDPPREQAGATERQLRTLRAFGFEHDGEVVFQSGRDALYQGALDELLQRGLAFPCRCSRSDLASEGGIHRRCVAHGHSPADAIRLRAPDSPVAFVDGIQGRFAQDVARDVGDVVLRRADGYWAYQLAVVVDDAAQGISDVVRGADLLDSTPRQIWLQQCLGLPTPRYAHLPLVLDHEGRKLAKSSAAMPIDDDDPLPALRAAWCFLGQEPMAANAAASPARWLQTAVAAFDGRRIPRAASSSTTAPDT